MLRCLLVALGTICGVVTATAAPSDLRNELKTCQDSAASPPNRIAACTLVIDSGRFKGQDLALTFINRGNGHFAGNNFDRAIADYTKAVEADPRYAQPYVVRGLAHSRKKNFDRAIADYSEALRIKPDHVQALVNRAIAYSQTMDFDRAIADAASAAKINPDNESIRKRLSFLRQQRGAASIAKGSTREGVTDLEAAATLDPANLRARLLLAQHGAATAPASGLRPPEIIPSVGHNAAMGSVSVSPDGKWVASAGIDGIKIWDQAKGQLVRTFGDNLQLVESVAFLPDSRTLVAGSADRMVRLWDIETGRIVRTLVGHTDAVLTVKAAGNRIVSAGPDKVIRVWDAQTGALLRAEPKHGAGPRPFLIAVRGRTVASVTNTTVALWDLETGNLERSFESLISPDALAISADGKAVAIATEKAITIHDRHTGEVRRVLESNGWIRWIDFLPGQNVLVTAARDYTISKWDLDTGQRTLELSGIEQKVDRKNTFVISGIRFSGLQSADFIDGGAQLVTIVSNIAGADMFGGPKLKFWDLAKGRQAREILPAARDFTSLAGLPSGSFIVAGDGNQAVREFNLTSGRLADVAPAVDNRRRRAEVHGTDLYVGEYQSIRRIALDTRQVKDVIHLKSLSQGSPWTVVPGASLLALASGSAVELQKIPSGDVERTLTGPSGKVKVVAASKDGRLVFAGYDTGVVSGWSVQDGRNVADFQAHERNISQIVFSDDASRVATADGSIIKIWDTRSGRLIREVSGHLRFIASVLFTPDGQKLIASSHDRFLSITDIASGAVERTLALGAGAQAMAFSPDRRLLLLAGSDSVLRVLEFASGREIVSAHVFTSGDWVTITPEGFFDGTDRGIEQLTVVHGLDSYSIDQFYQTLYRPDLVQEKLAGDPKGLVRQAASRVDLMKVIASGAAPKVDIVSPAPNAAVLADEVTAEASVTDNGGGIGRIEWRVNGLTLGVEERGLVRADQGQARAIQVSRKLSLEPGENVIEVVAYNRSNVIASDPARITVKWDGATSAARPKLYVVAVGVNDYWDSRIRLSYAVPDARAIADTLRKAGASLYQSVEVTTVLDADVTAANLEKVFRDLSEKVQPRDVFAFFLAGHGKTVDGKYYFLPYDFRYENEQSIVTRGIDQERFQSWFAQLRARKSILLYDTCESGSLTGDLVKQRGLERVAALDKMTRAMGRTILSASTEDAPALEGYRGHGIFTYALLDGLGAADLNGNGLIEVTELAGHIDQKVPDLSYQAFRLRQIPQMKIVGSNFALAGRLAEPAVATGQADALVAGKPTHVVIAPSVVRQSPEPGAPAVTELAAGTSVVLIRGESGWVIVARDGKRLGYVEERSLLRLQ
jgi:WD40 repeat protein/uncharacterized caspase-like protein